MRKIVPSLDRQKPHDHFHLLMSLVRLLSFPFELIWLFCHIDDFIIFFQLSFSCQPFMMQNFLSDKVISHSRNEAPQRSRPLRFPALHLQMHSLPSVSTETNKWRELHVVAAGLLQTPGYPVLSHLRSQTLFPNI